MRYFLVLFLALGVMGCSETSGTGGSGGDGGTGGVGGMPECEIHDECSDDNECTVDDCAPTGVCVYLPVEGPVPCGDLDNECTVGSCADGVCDSAPLDDGTACDQYNDCTVGTCAEGTCDSTAVGDGTSCAGGTCVDGACELAGTVLPCTEQGIRNAIATGGGPYTFDCDGPTTVTTEAEIVIDNWVRLDGEGNLTVDGNDDHRVFSVREGVNATLAGLGITGGVGAEEGTQFIQRAGGILNAGNLTLTNSTVSGNRASQAGGILNDGTLTVLNSRIYDNTVESAGGGILNHGTLTLVNSMVSGNTTTGERGWGGAGIFTQGTLTVATSTVSENGSASSGGGILHLGGTLTLVNSAVTANTAAGDYFGEVSIAGGGGILILGGTLMLSDSTVSGNTATRDGGGLSIVGVFDKTAATITNSTVSGNTAKDGGGTYADSLTPLALTLTNSTLSGNAATLRGGGMVLLNGAATIASSTLSANSAPEASGIHTAGELSLTNSLVDGNCDGGGEIASLGYNIESPGDTCGFDQPGDQVSVTAEQLSLEELSNNGGPTETHALGAGSVAIDKIPEADCVDADGEPLTTDQRGEPRDSMCDIGAFEVQP